VPALDRTFALAQVHEVAVMVAKHLEFDVPRVFQILLDVDVPDAERSLRFTLRGPEQVAQICRRPYDAHPAAAAAGNGLDDDRIADVLRALERLFFAVERPVAAGQHRHAGLLHRAASARLVAHQLDHIGVRADEADMARLADFREVRAFRKEAVARMNGVGAGDFGRADDRRDVQVAVGAPRRSDADVFIGVLDVQGVLIGLGIDSDRADTELAARDNHPQRDLSTIGDQDLFKHW
jgi:hypothetical protein